MNIKKGPWVVTDSKEVYKNPWIAVREDKVIRPDGRMGIFGVVTMKPGASVLPMDEAGNVYLVKEYRFSVERETIEVISGGIDANESPLEAAKRELREETGIEAEEWIDMGVVDPFTTVVNSQNFIFVARKLKFSDANPEGTEKIEKMKMPYAQAKEWVMESKITHGASCTLILKAGEWKK